MSLAAVDVAHRSFTVAQVLGDGVAYRGRRLPDPDDGEQEYSSDTRRWSTGYGRRFRMRVIRFGLTASVLSAPRRSLGRAIAFARRARRRGQRATIPFAYGWEQALARPLTAVRAELGIEPAEAAHPSGVLHGSTDTPWTFGDALS